MPTLTANRTNAGPAKPARAHYLGVLSCLFALFSSARLVSYLPTMWAIQASGDFSQHSLWTWCTWLGANLTMAAWLYEQSGQRVGKAVAVSAANATMCAVTVLVIAMQRHWLLSASPL